MVIIATTRAVAEGRPEQARHIATHFRIYSYDPLYRALTVGDLETVEWMHLRLSFHLANTGQCLCYMHTDLLEWLWKNERDWLSLNAGNIASTSRQGLDWCTAKGITPNYSGNIAVEFALFSGSSDEEYVLSYLGVDGLNAMCVSGTASEHVSCNYTATRNTVGELCVPYRGEIGPRAVKHVADWTYVHRFIASFEDDPHWKRVMALLLKWGMPPAT